MRCYLKKNLCNDAVTKNMHDSKNLWKTIKKILPSKTSSVASMFNKEDKCIVDSKNMANKFNNYFTSIGSELFQV